MNTKIRLSRMLDAMAAKKELRRLEKNITALWIAIYGAPTWNNLNLEHNDTLNDSVKPYLLFPGNKESAITIEKFCVRSLRMRAQLRDLLETEGWTWCPTGSTPQTYNIDVDENNVKAVEGLGYYEKDFPSAIYNLAYRKTFKNALWNKTSGGSPSISLFYWGKPTSLPYILAPKFLAAEDLYLKQHSQ